LRRSSAETRDVARMGSVARGARLVTTSEMTRVSRQGIHESRSIPQCFREGRALDPNVPEGCDTGRNRMRQRPNAAVPPEAVAFRSARKPAASSRCSRDPRNERAIRSRREGTEGAGWSRRSTDRGRWRKIRPGGRCDPSGQGAAGEWRALLVASTGQPYSPPIIRVVLGYGTQERDIHR
jgi:hypothetical protein